MLLGIEIIAKVHKKENTLKLKYVLTHIEVIMKICPDVAK
jgi:hypothetical protein